VASDRLTEASTSELKSAVFVSIRREVTRDLSRAPNPLGASEWQVTGKFESDTGELE
jgi:hypothetical protein